MRGSPVSFVAFVLVATAILGGIHYYLYHRLVRAPELGAPYQRIGAIAFVVLALLTPVGMFATRALERPASTVVAWIVYVWFGLAVLLFFGLVFGEVLRAG